MKVQPYLQFHGRCEEAIEFYRGAVGAEVEVVMRWKDCPQPEPGMIPPGAEKKVMHASFRIGETAVMASDGLSQGQQPTFQGFSLALTVPTDADAKRRFELLAEGGQVQQPLMPTFFTSNFGVVTDRFGVSWMVVVDAEAGGIR
ncbi:MAG: VOC family protein [Candidatus Rokuibacteriota bacterium]